jgi:hypothetical protein
VPVPMQILSHETLSGNNLCPLYGAIHKPVVVYVSAWKPASRNVKQLATSIDLKVGQIKISALKLERENLTVRKNPCSCHAFHRRSAMSYSPSLLSAMATGAEWRPNNQKESTFRFVICSLRHR